MPDRPPRRPIRILPPELSARIAAGEVVERPASVVKELVENALDAGARTIRIEVQGGGLHRIRVTDDGIGIPAEELPLACQRHATSKLPDGDLEHIVTLGFRGEALPSIAAVSELTLISATEQSMIGRRLTLSRGRIVIDDRVPHPPGTTVIVERLFENVPARLATVRQKQAEDAQILQVVRRLALAAPDVRFVLTIERRLALQTSGSGDLATTLGELYGPSLRDSLIEIAPFQASHARLFGSVSAPDVTQPSRAHLHIVVNRRWTQPRLLLAALEAAYRPLLPRGRHPILVLYLDLDPTLVDVNIHPAKLEVRLRDEAVIARAAAEQLRQALGRTPRTLRLTADTTWDPGSLRSLVAEEPEPYDDDLITTPHLPPLRLLGQLQERLLLLEGPDGLYLVDQHRAHERVLYEQLLASQSTVVATTTVLPEPLLIELRPTQATRLARWLDDLAALGFQCEVFGERLFLVRTVPLLPGVTDPASALSGTGEVEKLVPALLALLDEEPTSGESWRTRFLTQLACRTAIRRGRSLDRPAMRALVAALGRTTAPTVCPHGSPILLRVGDDTLARQFRW